MHPAFQRIDHRPWPHPAQRWTWRQSWRDLLFAHWPVSAAALRALVPAPLVVQEFEGTSWVGVVPFRMAGVMRRGVPDMPWVSAFPELNLRLYVEHEGRPGVWFLSLDATNALAVWAARRFFHLPYHRAAMRLTERESIIHYTSTRRDRAAPLRFEATYRPTGDVYASKPGSLEHWLTERYCLYAQSPAGRVYRGEVHHLPWPLQPAEAMITVNELTKPQGFELIGKPTLLHFARRIDVVVWSPQAI